MWDLWWAKWHCDRFFSKFFSFPVSIIPPLLHTRVSLPHEVCDSSDQAIYHHTLGTKLGASSLTGNWLETEEESKKKNITHPYNFIILLCKLIIVYYIGFLCLKSTVTYNVFFSLLRMYLFFSAGIIFRFSLACWCLLKRKQHHCQGQ
jgi:hypothetical protein